MPSLPKLEAKRYGANKKLEKLNPLQRMFVEEMLADPGMSATEAVKKAGYKTKNPHKQASDLLKNPIIQQVLGKRLQERIDRAEINQDDVLKFLYNALMLDPLELFDTNADGSLSIKQLQSIPQDIRRLITKLECKSRPVGDQGEVETRFKLEWVSKELVLQLCMKHLGLVTPPEGKDVNVSVTVVNPTTLVQQLRERVASKGRVLDGTVIASMVGN